MRPIDADKAKLNLITLSQIIRHSEGITANEIATALPSLLDNEPTADVQEVRHAHWRFDRVSYECSACEKVYRSSYNYCPNCGAKMDENEYLIPCTIFRNMKNCRCYNCSCKMDEKD